MLVEGKVIQLYLLVCEVFNVDFDGDQMVVYLFLSVEVQVEVCILMLFFNNILLLVFGCLLVMLWLDMVIGLYYLIIEVFGDIGEYQLVSGDYLEIGVYFLLVEVIMVVDCGVLSVWVKIKVWLIQLWLLVEIEVELFGYSGWQLGDVWMVEIMLGWVMFNELLLLGYLFVNKQMYKKVQVVIINDLVECYLMIVVVQIVDKFKDVGFYWVICSGVMVLMVDVLVLLCKKEIFDYYEECVDKVEKQFQCGVLNYDECNEVLVEIWKEVIDEVGQVLWEYYFDDNLIIIIVDFGVIGNFIQI